jgi:hypothetical protein
MKWIPYHFNIQEAPMDQELTGEDFTAEKPAKTNHHAQDLAEAIRKLEEDRFGGVFGFVRRGRAYLEVWELLAKALCALRHHHEWAKRNRPDYLSDPNSWALTSEIQLRLLEKARGQCDIERTPEAFFAEGYDAAQKKHPKEPLFMQIEQHLAWHAGLAEGRHNIRNPWGRDTSCGSAEEIRRAAAIQQFKLRK